MELKGVGLKPEYLFLQKLFATVVGLKKHIKDPNYITKKVAKILALRTLASPVKGAREILEIMSGPVDEQGARQNSGGRVERMCGAVLGKF